MPFIAAVRRHNVYPIASAATLKIALDAALLQFTTNTLSQKVGEQQ